MWQGIPPSLSCNLAPFSFGVLVYGNLARTHYSRVIADGGVIDNYHDLQSAVISLQRLYNSKNLQAYLSAAIDQSIFGYKIGAGSGTTLGRAATKLYSLMGAASDIEQGTATKQPLLLTWNSTNGNYLFVTPNTNANNARTPHSVSNNITGDIDIDYEYMWDKNGTIYGITKDQTTTQYAAFTTSPGNVSFLFFNGVSNEVVASTAIIPVSADTRRFARVKRIASTGIVTFYYSTDGVSWTQLGTPVASTVVNLTSDATAPVRLGAISGGSANGNKIYFTARLYNGDRDAGGVLVNNFIAADYDISVSQDTLVSSTTGETWTIERRTSVTGYKAQLVYRSTTQFDGIDDEMAPAGAFALAQPNTTYSVFDEMTWTAARVIVNGGTAVPYVQTTATPNMSSNAGSALNFGSESLNSLKAYMIQFNDASSISGTNGVYVTGAAGNAAFNDLDVGSSGGANYMTMIFNTMVIAKQADDLATRNSMNVIVRGWNGNPV